MDYKNHYNNHQRQQQRPSPYTYLHSNTFQGQTTPVAGPSSRRESPQQPNYLWQQSEDYEERERDQQEYISFVNQRRPYSRTSDTASIQFLVRNKYSTQVSGEFLHSVNTYQGTSRPDSRKSGIPDVFGSRSRFPEIGTFIRLFPGYIRPKQDFLN